MKMKNCLALCLALALVLALVPGVALAVDEAAQVENGNAYSTVQEAIDNANGAKVTLLRDVTESITIPSGKNITLNIPDGVTLTNIEGSHTITVKSGGTLTITGSGTVDNVSHSKGSLVNEGTAYLNGCTFTRSKEASTSATNSGSNSWYVIDNQGTMTINGAIVKNEGHFSSLIRNLGTASSPANLEIQSGLLQQNDFIAVKNDDYGDLKVTGGTIISNDQAIQNWATADVSGGTLQGPVITWAYGDGGSSETTISGDAKITGNVYAVTYSGTAVPTVEISGGTVNGTLGKFTYSNGLDPAEPTSSGQKISVTAGSFSSDVKDYIQSGYDQLAYSSNNYVVGQYSDTTAANTMGQTVYKVTYTQADGTIVDVYYLNQAEAQTAAEAAGMAAGSVITVTIPTSTGGSSTPSTYPVSTPSGLAGGTVSVSPAWASSGATVTITALPEAGYGLASLSATDANGNALLLTKVSDTQYTFTMPSSRVRIDAAFTSLIFLSPPKTGGAVSQTLAACLLALGAAGAVTALRRRSR